MARPRKINKEVLQKLEEAFSKGLSDALACLYAGISPSTLYNYCNAKPEFSERKEVLKKTPEMNARINLARKIEDGDIGLSQYYLERKCKDEFSTKQEVKLSADINNPFAKLTDEELKRLAGSDE